ncbi:hypothetical protein HBI17_107090 [Parastagonospora nodorum]|nr:hypothetical protein HBI17_107090 [Parastagonospora nodorum]
MDASSPPSAPPPPVPDALLPALKRYAHLYMPLITAIVMAIISAPDRPTPWLLFATFALPTYLLASMIYPANREVPDHVVRFTRRHDAFRALVLFMYGRLFGTPFNLQFLIADYIASYVLGYAIGEKPHKRHSEFLLALAWVGASALVLNYLLPGNFWVTVADRAIWRAAWLALVDDVVGALERPDVRTAGGRARLVIVQAGVILGVVWWLQAVARRGREIRLGG